MFPGKEILKGNWWDRVVHFDLLVVSGSGIGYNYCFDY